MFICDLFDDTLQSRMMEWLMKRSVNGEEYETES
jgi:hypothetical protein